MRTSQLSSHNSRLEHIMADARNTQNTQLLPFFLISAVLALPSYILMGLTVKDFILSPELAPSFVPLAVIAPLCAALYLNWRQGGWPAVKFLLARALDYKRIKNRIWYVIAFGLPVAIVFLAGYVSSLLNLIQLPPELPLAFVPVALVAFFSPH